VQIDDKIRLQFFNESFNDELCLRTPIDDYCAGAVFDHSSSGGRTMRPAFSATIDDVRALRPHIQLAMHMVNETGVAYCLVMRQNRYTVVRADKLYPHDLKLETIKP
jgi:hypothetical protein